VNERRGNPVEPEEPSRGITRREALRRGALLGGALVWTTPIVQAIGIRPAFAQVPSGFCRIELTVFGVGTSVCAIVPQHVCDCFDAGAPTLQNLIACLAGVDPSDILDC
jgi:hypothetical protein